MTETYEQIRDSATGEAGAAWTASDGFAYDGRRGDVTHASEARDRGRVRLEEGGG